MAQLEQEPAVQTQQPQASRVSAAEHERIRIGVEEDEKANAYSIPASFSRAVTTCPNQAVSATVGTLFGCAHGLAHVVHCCK